MAADQTEEQESHLPASPEENPTRPGGPNSLTPGKGLSTTAAPA